MRGPVRTPFAEEGTVSGKVLDAVVIVFRNVNVAVTGDGNAGRVVELTVTGSHRTPFAEKRTRGCKILYAMAVGIGDVNVAVRRYRYSFRILEITVART